MANIFLSYARNDGSEIAEELVNRLRAMDHQVFFDMHSITAGAQWRSELSRRIKWADIILVLVTPASNNSDYVYAEITEAADANKIIVPIQVEDTPLPVYLRGTWQAIRFANNNYEAVLLELERTIAQLPAKRSRWPRVLLFLMIVAVMICGLVAFFLRDELSDGTSEADPVADRTEALPTLEISPMGESPEPPEPSDSPEERSPTTVVPVIPTTAVPTTAVPTTVVPTTAVPTTAVPSSQAWNGNFCFGQEICKTGDVNGDGRDDIIAFVNGSNDGRVWVATSNGSGFNAGSVWHGSFCIGNEICEVGDVNGDGRDDIIAFVNGSNDGRVWVATSNGSGFNASSVWHDSFCFGNEICEVGDVDGDGKDDIVAFVRSLYEESRYGDVWVSISTGSNFDPNNTNVWNNNFCLDLEVCTLGDVNGDGRDDLIAFLRGTQGIVFAGTSTGSSFSGGVIWHNNFCYGNETCAVGDINNDGMDDILAFSHSLYDASRHGEIWTATSTGSGFNASQLPYTGFCLGNSVCMSGDFNGDGWDDAIAFLRNAFSGDSAGDVEVQLFP